MMNIVTEKWDEIIHKLKVEHDLSDISFRTWIEPLKVHSIEGNILYVIVPIKEYIEFITKKYLLPLQVNVAEITGYEYDIRFISVDESARMNQSNHDSSTLKANNKNNIFERANLKSKYTFDTFVVGNNNNFAHAASLAVAESPGEIYNPLFLYGGVGLGKTHLMHSIAHFILEKNPDKKVLYVTSETFTNELIEALKTGKTNSGNELAMTAFREKYRNIDVLLIDDIQFIIGRVSTQEEFFHTFNHLHAAGKQIIISSDKPPKDIATLEARLRTRFEWGLIADISSPDYETRMAILRKKEELDDLKKYNIPDEVIEYIATNVTSNIRELEGSLNKLIALHKLKNKNIDIVLAAEALKDFVVKDDYNAITPEYILDIVAEHFGITTNDLKGNKRSSDISVPRQIAMYLCHTMTDTPLKAIGYILGGKHHTTITYGVERITEMIEEDEALCNTIDIIKKKINPLLCG